MTNPECGCNCQEVYEALYELVYESVSETRRVQLVAHINDCPGCLEKIGLEQEVASLLRRCCCEPAPPTLREKVLLRLQIARSEITWTH
ncbi:mycothiol system anti-sigma-R factor [Corynebacterium choanae]|uniref:Anti-sigma factor RsrA n=1 Tax=Corynebacterium choanae TaxID=1862358 RepID=A0A3G6J4Q7_9CORY|nr:mycothiol system anti-sigma-R factor [Corynebacterium choanae]AZA12929.1 Anti-sigma factor RsrA [Corynebacterium choanae]